MMMNPHHRGSTKRVHERVNPIVMDPRATRMRKGKRGAEDFAAMTFAEAKRIMRGKKRQAAYDASLRGYHPLLRAPGLTA